MVERKVCTFKRERKMVKRIIMGNKKGVKTGLES